MKLRRMIAGCALVFGIVGLFLVLIFRESQRAEDPLCASIEEDPCFVDGVFEIFCA